MPKKMSHEEFLKKVKEVYKNNYDVLGKYVNSKTKILIKHNVCGYTWETNPYSFTKGHGCPFCANNINKDTKWFKNKVLKLVGNEYTVLGEYVNNKTEIKIKHNLCGNVFKMKPNAFLNGGQRCPKERYIKSAEENRQIQGKPKEKNDKINYICETEGYEVIKGYIKANVNLILKHKKCGIIFKIRPYHFITTGVRCSCETESKGERVIREWLTKNNIKFKEQYRFDDCKGNKKRLPFDFAIFNNHNNLIYLIEFDGLQHFTPRFGIDNFNDIKRNDKIKDNYCIEKEIPLIRIKYNRSLKYSMFSKKIINELLIKLSNINMAIPNQAYEETLGRCND